MWNSAYETLQGCYISVTQYQFIMYCSFHLSTEYVDILLRILSR